MIFSINSGLNKVYSEKELPHSVTMLLGSTASITTILNNELVVQF